VLFLLALCLVEVTRKDVRCGILQSLYTFIVAEDTRTCAAGASLNSKLVSRIEGVSGDRTASKDL
jgi:hypothetical protein